LRFTAKAICSRIAEGESLRTICKDSKMPSRATVFQWLTDNEDFQRAMSFARDIQADTLADEILEIADTEPMRILHLESFHVRGLRAFSRTDSAIAHAGEIWQDPDRENVAAHARSDRPPQIHHNAVVGTVAAWTARYCPIVFAGSVEAAANFSFRCLAGQVKDIQRASAQLADVETKSMNRTKP
jgi:hypothetical protein